MEIVARLHEQEIIHRDLNPANIVCDTPSGRLMLVDFGSAIAPHAAAPAAPKESRIEGTLPYVSPEQTGRTGHTIDHRTDLYALGATFYELLTGSPPFAATDPVELIHAHLTRRPAPPHEQNAGILPLLSEIVLKLLAKTPGERCQTAAGLLADLRAARDQWTASGRVEPFLLGRRDMACRLEIPETLYGRSKERQALLDAFDRVRLGERELVLVTGGPGTGKSVLVNSIQPAVVEQHGFCAQGKFDQLQGSVPYPALVDAFRMLGERLLAERGSSLEVLRGRIQAAASPNGRVLTDLIPGIEHILGPQPAVPVLGPGETRHRLNMAFRAFVGAVAQPPPGARGAGGSLRSCPQAGEAPRPSLPGERPHLARVYRRTRGGGAPALRADGDLAGERAPVSRTSPCSSGSWQTEPTL